MISEKNDTVYATVPKEHKQYIETMARNRRWSVSKLVAFIIESFLKDEKVI